MNREEEEINKHCKHFLIRKKRYCRMIVKSNDDYCGEHQPNTTNDDLPLSRITCPLDNKHTCYVHKLKRHLKICNARKDVDQPSYIQYGINSDPTAAEDDNNKRNLKSVDLADVSALVTKIEKIYADIEGQVMEVSGLDHKVLRDELANAEYGNDTRKHLLQTSSLLGLLEHRGLIKANTCFIEFGGGKGKLSYWLTQASNHLSNTSVLLIDKASHRHKHDNKCREHVVRLRADIQDLVLENVDAISRCERAVGVAKHLCGAATDLALKCMENVDKIRGIVLAFCCHHRCRWSSYVGKEFFDKSSLTREDFDVMCGLVSWATCGHSEIEKIEIGRKCKLVLDWGRLLFIRNVGFNCALHRYVSTDVSLENICIVAYRNDCK